MGARGPLPLTPRILEARGSRRAGTASQPAAFTTGAPPCPSHLAGEARAEWRRVTKELLAAGVLCKADRAVLVAYCEAWADYLIASTAVAGCLKADAEAGLSRAIHLGYVKQKKQTADQVARLASQLGCTPSARTRVKAQQEPSKKAVGGKRSPFWEGA